MGQIENINSEDILKGLANIPDRSLSTEEFREWIEASQKQITDANESFDRHTCLTQGYTLQQAITPGIYIRELTMPAGQLIFSKIHMQEHPFVIMKGSVSVYDGTEIKHFTAPYKNVTPAGTKRVLFTHEETIWITFHPITDETIEDCDKNGVIACETFEEYDQLKIERATR